MEGFFNKIKKGASEAGKQAKMTVEMNRLKMQMASKQKEIDSRYFELGQRVLKSYNTKQLANIEEEVTDLCTEINEFLKEISYTETKMMELRGEKRCECGNAVNLEANFCAACGHKFLETLLENETVKIEETKRLAEEAITKVKENNTFSCPSCHTSVEHDSKFCENCGQSLKNESTTV